MRSNIKNFEKVIEIFFVLISDSNVRYNTKNTSDESTKYDWCSISSLLISIS